MTTTTRSQHTPGPWKVDDESAPSMAGVFVRVGGDPFNGNMGIPVSADSLTPYRCVGSLETEMRANARLIAAAPEMLATLREMAHAITQGIVAASEAAETGPTRSVMRERESRMRQAQARLGALLAKIEGRP